MKWGSEEGQGIVRQRSQPGEPIQIHGMLLNASLWRKIEFLTMLFWHRQWACHASSPLGSLSVAPSCLLIPILEIFTRSSSCPRECGKGTISDVGRRWCSDLDSLFWILVPMAPFHYLIIQQLSLCPLLILVLTQLRWWSLSGSIASLLISCVPKPWFLDVRSVSLLFRDTKSPGVTWLHKGWEAAPCYRQRRHTDTAKCPSWATAWFWAVILGTKVLSIDNIVETFPFSRCNAFVYHEGSGPGRSPVSLKLFQFSC